MTLTNPFRRRGPRWLTSLPRVVRLYILHSLIGFALAAVFTGLILAFDVGSIRHLVTHVAGGWLALFVFFMLNGIVFAGVQTGITIMSMDYPGRPPKSGRKSHFTRTPSPVRIDAG